MEYVKVRPCKARGCNRPVWESGEDYCDRCREEMEALDIDEPKSVLWLASVLGMALFLGLAALCLRIRYHIDPDDYCRDVDGECECACHYEAEDDEDDR